MITTTDYSRLARAVNYIQNPNRPVGALIEDFPSDLGRSYEGYKRGGIIEGLEKIRKEVMAAVVWLFGIPAFKWIGDKFCEKTLNIPMAIDFCKSKEGNDSIRDSVEFLTLGKNPKNLDTKELVKKYGDRFKLNETNPKEIETKIGSMVKKIKASKKTTSFIAVVLNCLAMGVILPKVNQKITKNRIERMKEKEFSDINYISLKEYKESLKNKKNANKINFTGGMTDMTDNVAYKVENDSIFRLIITDFPMMIGRMVTSRNKFEALEFLMMDGAGLYLYNFASDDVQKLLRKIHPTPKINPVIAEEISKQDSSTLKNAIANINNGKTSIGEILNEDLKTKIYTQGTYGKYGKINKFVKDSDIKELDNSVVNFIKYLKDKTDGAFSPNKIKELTKKVNLTNSVFLGMGLLTSIIGLAYVVPKICFGITKKLSGQEGFVGTMENHKKIKQNEETTKNTQSA